MSGAWQMLQTGSNRACTIRLGQQATEGGLALGLPAPCRRALPILLNVRAWGLEGDRTVLLMTGEGETVLRLRMRQDGALEGNAESGQGFELRPDPNAPAGAVPGEAARVRVNPAVPVAMTGRYELLRAGDAPTGCSLQLEARIGPRIGSGRAALSGDCGDKGLIEFDPAGWRLEGKDRLFLIARKGQQIGFSKERDTWFKDPANGAPLKLVRQP